MRTIIQTLAFSQMEPLDDHSHSGKKWRRKAKTTARSSMNGNVEKRFTGAGQSSRISF
jgi:hypothetical protein